VLVQQIENEKQYMTGLRDVIGALSDLVSGGRTVLNVAEFVRYTSYTVLAATGLGGAAKTVLGKIIMRLGVLTGLGAIAGEARLKKYLNEGEVPEVQRMIDEAEREFLAAERRIRQYRREYRELGCEVTLGKAP